MSQHQVPPTSPAVSAAPIWRPRWALVLSLIGISIGTLEVILGMRIALGTFSYWGRPEATPALGFAVISIIGALILGASLLAPLVWFLAKGGIAGFAIGALMLAARVSVLASLPGQSMGFIREVLVAALTAW